MTPLERFMAKVTITDGCWVWGARISDGGYGQFKLGRRMALAHRAAYQLFVGAIPAGMQLDHRCHTEDAACPGGPGCRHRRCVNPAHLEPVSHLENIFRGRSLNAINAAKTHCDSGHEFDAANTYVRPDGNRDCRKCKAERSRRCKARRRDAAAGQTAIEVMAA